MTSQYRERFQKGLEYQDFAVRCLYDAGIPIVCYGSFRYQTSIGENIGGYEIKFDDRMKDTGNVYVELAEKTDANNTDFVASGILRNDNTWIYVIGDYHVIYLCGKIHLRQVYAREQDKEESFVKFVETPTSRGMLLPQKYVETMLSLKTIRIKSKRND